MEQVLDRMIIRGGSVLTMDPVIGDFPQANILVERGRITAVGPAVDAPVAEEIDASGMIVIPGFIDTHRHMWEGVLRSAAPDHILRDYFTHVRGVLGMEMHPEDMYLGNLLSALGALDAGVTTVQDTSNAQNTPQHADAAVQALWDAGIRAVFSFGPASRTRPVGRPLGRNRGPRTPRPPWGG